MPEGGLTGPTEPREGPLDRTGRLEPGVVAASSGEGVGTRADRFSAAGLLGLLPVLVNGWVSGAGIDCTGLAR